MTKASKIKPRKPYPNFPLTAHLNGQWCKKIRGKIHFFGVWASPDAALEHYLKVAADLHAGRLPATVLGDEFTVKQMANEYLAYQMDRATLGQIGWRLFEDCRRVIRHFAKHVGISRDPASLGPTDFQDYRRVLSTVGLGAAKPGFGVHAMTRTITIVRGMFKWAVSTGLLAQAPRWGTGFVKPSAADIRRSKAKQDRENGKRFFTAEQLRELIAGAQGDLKAAVLLGINGGFGNTDCAALPIATVDLTNGLIDFERPKTAVRRVVPLWPESVEALRQVLESKRCPASDAETKKLVFRTESGVPLVRQLLRRDENGGIKSVTYMDRLGDWFDELLESLSLKRKGIGFYTLRHTFRTWADEVGDQHAILRTMGHAIPGMSGMYIEEISVERLRRVVDHVRTRLWPDADKEVEGDMQASSPDQPM